MDDETPIWDFPSNHTMLASHVPLAGKRVVDVGAGAGALVRFMRSKGADPIGVECGEAMISQARAADLENLDAYVDGVGQDLPLDDESADVVVFSYSLHHVPGEHIASALAEANRVLRRGGTLAVLEPIPEGPGFETHKLVDDETIVRAAAQAGLDNDLPASMNQINEVRYTTSFSYKDFDDLEKRMTDIDPARGAALEAVKEETSERFHANGEQHGDLYWFAQPVLMRVFAKS
jgi:ubiquinone/menaquinone biosynthesis C-methylase UbiE